LDVSLASSIGPAAISIVPDARDILALLNSHLEILTGVAEPGVAQQRTVAAGLKLSGGFGAHAAGLGLKLLASHAFGTGRTR